MFGEIAFLDGSSRSADVVADEAAEVLELPYPAFLALKEKPRFPA